MKIRKVIIVGVAIAIVALGVVGKNLFAEPAEKEKPSQEKKKVTVFATEVNLGDVQLEVATTGSLEAKDRMELFSEVQGLMLPDRGRFKAGASFKKGETLIGIRADDARSRVVAQRSGFERLLSSVMADIRLDYPDDYQGWSTYLDSFSAETTLGSLPEVSNPQLKSYLTGRNIFAEYHSVRNAEIGLSRYRLSAPFSGVLNSANVDPGTVIRPGMLLGVFVKPGNYELQASIDARTLERLKKGQKVSLMLDGQVDKIYEGTVSRVSPSVNPQTQMSDFFVEVKSDLLKEGQFMHVMIEAQTIENAFEIDRSAIQDTRYAFVVEKGLLRKKEISILHRGEKTAVVRGLQNGDKVLTKLPPTAFDGLEVTIYTEDAR